jgi:hypothetical protein
LRHILHYTPNLPQIALPNTTFLMKYHIERAQWADTEDEWSSAGLGPRRQTQPSLTSFLA